MILGSIQYIKIVMDDPGYLGKYWVCGLDHYRSIFLQDMIMMKLTMSMIMVMIMKKIM